MPQSRIEPQVKSQAQTLAQSLEQLHRQLTDLWSDTADRPCDLTFSEYGYLRAIERLDGEQLARGKGEHVPEAIPETKPKGTPSGKLAQGHSDMSSPVARQPHTARPETENPDTGHHLQDLVDLLKVRKASASVAITKLEKRGLIYRFACQYDARAQHIVLTDKGRESLRAEEVIYEKVAARIENLLTAEELTDLQGNLSKVSKVF